MASLYFRLKAVDQPLRKALKSFKECQYHDVCFITRSGPVFAHRFVLAASSRFMEMIFKQASPHVDVSVTVTDVDASDFNHVLEMLYCGSTIVSREKKSQVGELLRSLEIAYTDSGSFVETVGEESENNSNREPEDGSKEPENENQVPSTVRVKSETLTSEVILFSTGADNQSGRNNDLPNKDKRKCSPSWGIRRSKQLKESVLSLKDNSPQIQVVSSDSEKDIKQTCSCLNLCEVKGDVLRCTNCEAETSADEAQASEDMECSNNILEANLSDLSRSFVSTSEKLDQECGGQVENTTYFVVDGHSEVKIEQLDTEPQEESSEEFWDSAEQNEANDCSAEDLPFDISIRCNSADSEFPIEAFDTKHRAHAVELPSVQTSIGNKGGTSWSSSAQSGFASKSLRNEKQTYAGKKHVCDTCGKTFPSRHKLMTHGVTHTGEKPFTCDICGKSFSQSSTMNHHRLLHSEVYARLSADQQSELTCDACGKIFTRKTRRDNHFRIVHMRELPFECDLCPKKYGSRDGLRRHKLEGHKIEFV